MQSHEGAIAGLARLADTGYSREVDEVALELAARRWGAAHATGDVDAMAIADHIVDAIVDWADWVGDLDLLGVTGEEFAWMLERAEGRVAMHRTALIAA
ncbi:hypothetical protein CXR34_13530 [Microbacterium hominis]|uniref:Uncharacterized protein n=2 Tax=Microbacteriaceae TaxID=85023 RepID=A0A2K9DPQ2_9MICO|nr:hypothetical protein CXR34_13530 [Microbacterium hominis]